MLNNVLHLRGQLVAFRLIVMLGLVSVIMSIPPPTTKHIRPNVTILALWSSVGNFAYGYGTDVMIYYKAANQLAKFHSDPSWPYHANYEFVDWQSNLTFLHSFMHTRLNRTLSHALPPVSVIFGAEGNAGYTTAPIANTYSTCNSSLCNHMHHHTSPLIHESQHLTRC